MAFIVDPQCPVPEFIGAADLAIKRLLDVYDDKSGRVSGMVFFGEHFFHDGKPYDYCRCSAFGKPVQLIETIADCFRNDRRALELMTKAWIQTYLNATVDDKDPHVREERRILLRLVGKGTDGSPISPADEANAMADQILREHPERTVALTILKQQAKKYRQSGLNDMRIIIEQRMADLRLSIAQDEQQIVQTEADAEALAANIEIDAEYRRQQLAEARRVKEMRLADLLDEQEIEHDYQQLLRRAKTRREFISRMEAEASRLEEQARLIQQQHPQFDAHSAAKRKRQQIAARQRERAAHKKKGQESSSGSTLFT